MTAPVFYHGTRRGFRSGGVLLPAALTGAPDNHGLGRTAVVYVTPDLELAWDYAEAALGRGRPKVLVVRPLGPLAVDESTCGGQEQASFACSWARVLRVLAAP